MVALPITSMTAAILVFVMLALSAQISMRRAKLRAVFGDAGDGTLRRRIRAHGNFIEYAPMALVVLILMELAGAAPNFVWALAGSFVVSRVLHAVGMLYTSTPTVRAVAILINHSAFLVSGGWLISKFV